LTFPHINKLHLAKCCEVMLVSSASLCAFVTLNPMSTLFGELILFSSRRRKLCQRAKSSCRPTSSIDCYLLKFYNSARSIRHLFILSMPSNISKVRLILFHEGWTLWMESCLARVKPVLKNPPPLVRLFVVAFTLPRSSDQPLFSLIKQ